MRWAVYDLARHSPSFDFLTFIQGAFQAGAEGIWFKRGYQAGPYGGEEGQRKRVKTICFPICHMYRMPYALASHAPPSVFDECGICVQKTLKSVRPLEAGQAALDRANDRFRGRRPIVVSIRHCTYQPERDSSPAWRRWAADHDAEIVEDWFDDPIPLEDRVACYQLASMNIGVSAGVQAINIYSYRPYLILKYLVEEVKASSTRYFKRMGWKPGEQMPWATKYQNIVWNNKDDYATIEVEYRAWLKRSEEALFDS